MQEIGYRTWVSAPQAFAFLSTPSVPPHPHSVNSEMFFTGSWDVEFWVSVWKSETAP